jgi:hypothetical protein
MTPEEKEALWDLQNKVYLLTPQQAKEKLGVDIPHKMKLYPLPNGINENNRNAVLIVVQASLETLKASMANHAAWLAYGESRAAYLNASEKEEEAENNSLIDSMNQTSLDDQKMSLETEVEESSLAERMNLTSLEENVSDPEILKEAMDKASKVWECAVQAYLKAQTIHQQVQKKCGIFNASVG